jgi:hypothetical protein
MTCLGSWLRLLTQKRLSNAKLTWLTILMVGSHSFGEQIFYFCFRVHRLRFIKSLTHLWAPLVRKRVCALK